MIFKSVIKSSFPKCVSNTFPKCVKDKSLPSGQKMNLFIVSNIRFLNMSKDKSLPSGQKMNLFIVSNIRFLNVSKINLCRRVKHTFSKWIIF